MSCTHHDLDNVKEHRNAGDCVNNFNIVNSGVKFYFYGFEADLDF